MWKAVVLGLLLTGAARAIAAVATESESHISVQVHFGAVELVDVSLAGRQWQELRCDTPSLPGTAGAPSLPWITRLIELPPTGRFSCNYSLSGTEILRAPALIPEQERVSDERSSGPLPFVLDESAYTGSTLWSQQDVILGEPVIVRNRRMAKLTWYPCRWNPENGELLVSHELDLVIQPESGAGTNELRFELPRHNGPLEHLANALLDVPLAHEDGTLSSIFDRPALPGTYLIIGHSGALTNSLMQQFIEWKRSRGHVVHVYDEEQIGTLNADNIYSAIRNSYYNDEYPPDFVMLIGDPDGDADFHLPARDTQYDGEQDHGYSRLEGDDILGDVAVGRISVSNQAQLASVLTKIMLYEKTPLAAGEDWLARAALSTGYDAVSMVHLCRSIAQRFRDAGYMRVDTLWYHSSASWVNARFNEGISQYCYRGWIDMNGVTTSFVNNDANFTNSGRCPVACIFTCSTGDFNGNLSTTEAFLRKGTIDNPRGAVAAMGFATSATHTAYNNAVVAGYYSGIHDLQLPIGPAVFRGKYNLWATLPEGDINAIAFSNRANLMGDPGLEDWNGPPQALTLSCAEGSEIPFGQALLTFRVADENGDPLEGVTVCAYQAGHLQERALTNAAGVSRLSLVGAVPGEILVTASARNFFPEQMLLPLGEASSMLVLVGAAPDALIPGVPNTVSPQLRNGGSTELNAISLQFNTEGNSFFLSDSLSSLVGLAPGEELAGDPITLVPVATLVDGGVLQIPVTLGANGFERADGLGLSVVAPVLDLVEARFNDAEVLDPAMDIELKLRYTNTGHLDAEGLRFELSSTDPMLSVVSQPEGAVSLGVGQSADIHATISLSAAAFDGCVLELQCHWSCSNGPAGDLEHRFAVGTPTTLAPGGPDAYGYYLYEDLDNNTKSPIFDWREIAEIGTQLPISDLVDQDDEALRIELPFDFVYYGQSYSSVVVCTNGFIAFGTGAEFDPHYRNHRLPSATGPHGMVAPFWDDLLTADGGGVYTFHDLVDHIFVVEWHEMSFNGGSSNRNTFQVLLHDPAYHETQSGDGDIVMQWNTWNNEQENSTDFPYCSVGIESPDNQSGFNLSNYNINGESVFDMYAAKAVCFSTDRGERLVNETMPPILHFLPPQLVQCDYPILFHCFAFDPSGVDEVILHVLEDGGDTASPMSWSAEYQRYEVTLPARAVGDEFAVFVAASDQATTPNWAISDTTQVVVHLGNPVSGPDGYGHAAREEADIGSVAYSWVDVATPENRLDFSNVYYRYMPTDPLRLVWFGEEFDFLTISNFGVFNFGQEPTYWMDLSPMADNNGTPNQVNILAGWFTWFEDVDIYCDIDEEEDRVVISFHGLEGVSEEGEYYDATFQAVVYDADRYPTTNGDSAILFQYQHVRDLTWSSVGFQNESMSDGLNLCYNGELIDNLSELDDGTAILISSGWVVDVPPSLQALTFRIEGVWPNPFNPTARVSFQLPDAGPVKLSLYNLLGQEVTQLINAQMPAGSHNVMLDGEGLASGIYLLRLSCGDRQEVRRVTLLR